MTSFGMFMSRAVHGGLGILTYAVVLGLAQWAFLSWLRRAWPGWVSRHRNAIVAALVLLWAFSLLRDARLPVRLSRTIAVLLGADVVWQFALASAMILLFSGRFLLRIVLSLRERMVGRSRDDTAPSAEEAPSPTSAKPGQSVAADAFSRRIALERLLGAATLGATTGAFGWGMARGRWEWTTVDVPVRMPRLPRALDGFTIVQVSDIHTGLFLSDRDLAEGLRRIERLKPDLVVVTGDIIDRDPQYIPVASRRLAEVRARLGVACIPGNHDYYTGVDLVLDGMRRAGIDVLRNEGRLLLPHEGGGIALLGLDDLSAARRGLGPDLARAKSMVPPDRPTVLLVHQPQVVERVAGQGVDLQLSGHTHGGQVYLGAGIASLVSRFVAGRYDVDGTTLYVNRGFGTAGPPTRIGVTPEITRLVLVAA